MNKTKPIILLLVLFSCLSLLTNCSAPMIVSHRKEYKILKETPIVIQISNYDNLNAEAILRNELLKNGFHVLSVNELNNHSRRNTRGKNPNIYYPSTILLRVKYNVWINYSTFNYFNVEIVDVYTKDIITVIDFNQNVGNSFFAASPQSVVKKFVDNLKALVE